MNNTNEDSGHNITVARRARLMVLLQEYVRVQVAEGVQHRGLEAAFASELQVSRSLLSQIKKSRPISDKLARQIEAACHVPNGWLDQPMESATPDTAEEAFVELAKRAWRGANAKQKRALRKAILDAMQMVGSGDSQ